MKKNILFVIWSFSHGGGAEKILSNIVNNLDKDKYNIDILEYYYIGIKKEDIPSHVNLLPPITNVTNKSILNRIKNYLYSKIIFCNPKFIRRIHLNKKYDVEIAFNYMIPTYLLDYDSKTIGWVHGALDDMKFNKKTRKIQNKTFNKIDRIVAISNKTYESIIETFPEYKNKVNIINNGFNFEEIYNKVNKKETIDNIDLLFCGRLDENKNPLKFLEIVDMVQKEIKDIKVGILGQGILDNEIKKKIKELKLENNVILYGFKSNPYTIMNSTKLMCLTSISEGFPTVLIEGMALGKPFISTEVAGIEEMKNDNKCGFSTNDNCEYAKYIISLLKDNELYKKMSENSSEHVKKFNLQNQISKLEELIEEVTK